MSTRCEVGIYPKGDYIFNKPYMVFYKHCDGHPDLIETMPFKEGERA